MIPEREPTDLAVTDERISLLESALAAQRQHLDRLAHDGLGTAPATVVLQAGEAVLKSLRAYRKLLSGMPTG